MKKPLISVITVTLNSEKYLLDTMNSVSNQTYQNIEHIIIDGGSTDQTLEIIKKNESSILKWTSETDKGIADAMNKGIKKSTGDYIIFLHSDDYFIDQNSLKEASNYLNNKNHIYLFKVLLDNGSHKIISKNKNLGFSTNFKMGSCHQGHICSRQLFNKIGFFDQEFEITMDYDFILRAYREGFKSLSVNKILSTMRLVGISSKNDWESLNKRFTEERKAHLKNTKYFWHSLLYKGYWLLYIPYRKIKYQVALLNKAL